MSRARARSAEPTSSRPAERANEPRNAGPQDAEPPVEVAHFRRASVVVTVASLALLGLGLVRDAAASTEIALGVGGFALLVGAATFVPRWHARFVYLHPKHFFLATWLELDREAERERAHRAPGSYDTHPLVALATGAVCLALMEYFGHTVHFGQLVDAWEPSLRDSPHFELMGFAWWSVFRVLGYFVVPAIVAVAVFREPLREHGLETRGFFEHAWIYAVSYAVVLLCVVLVARHHPHFQSYYPFYRQANRSWADFWAWELLYAAQFFSLEFFFRGFWLRAMRPSMGSQAIFAMVVPYCMIHFGKPFLETLAAIVAGIVLGTLSMKTRSIWSGFLIHVSVAVSMDVAALLATAGLPERTWP